jgi:hypothetical protein
MIWNVRRMLVPGGRLPEAAPAAGGDPVPHDQEEQNRILGVPLRADSAARGTEEPQRVLGIPMDSFGLVDVDRLRGLAHPIKRYKRWVQHRRFGPYVPEDDQK